MSTARVNRMAETSLGTTLNELEAEVSELRAGAPQFIGGASIKYFQSQTAASADWTGTLPDPGGLGHGGKLFLVTATANTMPVFWGDVHNRLYADTVTNLYDGLQYLTDYKLNNSPLYTSYTDAPNNALLPNQKQWFCQLSGNGTRTLWIKFFVLGIDTATLTVTALS
jgi:hypothetical protein